MSVKLHGVEVNVGDKVWSLINGWIDVVERHTNIAKNRITPNDILYFKENALFWQPIAPEAIDAAKLKPEPEYEWKWQYTYLDETGNFLGINETRYYKTEKEMLTIHALLSRVDFIRIERSKREVEK